MAVTPVNEAEREFFGKLVGLVNSVSEGISGMDVIALLGILSGRLLACEAVDGQLALAVKTLQHNIEMGCNEHLEKLMSEEDDNANTLNKL